MRDETLVLEDRVQQVSWRNLYQDHLVVSLEKILDFVKSCSIPEIKEHIISILTLIEESANFTALKDLRMKLVIALHPLPLRWGLAYRWESRMLEIIEDPARGEHKNRFLVDLGDYYVYSGKMLRAIEVSEKVLLSGFAEKLEAADAIRILFTAYRILAKPDEADKAYNYYGEQFGLFKDPAIYDGRDLKAWVKVHLTELEILREKGKTDEALALVNNLIGLEDRIKDSIGSLSAELHVHRSTLLWVKARYADSIRDLELAITKYLAEEDFFNAESLKSNLGLIYWTMGELSKAEQYLSEAILYYKKCGADQLMVYDIGNLGLVYFAQGYLEKAKQKTNEHIEFADRIGFSTEAYRGHTNLGDILYYFHQFDRAIEEHEMVEKYYEDRGSREGFGLGKVWVACCRAKLGDVKGAITELTTILQWCSEHHSRVLEALTHRALAQWLPPAERQFHLQQSLNLACEQGRQLEEAASLLMLARTYDDPVQRLETWNSGVHILERIGATAWLDGVSIENPPFIAMFI